MQTDKKTELLNIPTALTQVQGKQTLQTVTNIYAKPTQLLKKFVQTSDTNQPTSLQHSPKRFK